MCGRGRLSSDVTEIKLRRLAALFIILALVGCAPVATGQGQAPDAPIRMTAVGISAACSDQSAPERGTAL
jgi:hypothetical protein